MLNCRKIEYRHYCREPIENIENYALAVADIEHEWVLHHRDEVHVLPSGMVARRSKRELIENGRYYGCPASELIFLERREHAKLHKCGVKRPGIGGHRYGAPCNNRAWLTGRSWAVINGKRTWLSKVGEV